MEMSGQHHAPGHFTPVERAPGTHSIGGWVGPRASPDTVVKRKILSPCQELNPGTPIGTRNILTDVHEDFKKPILHEEIDFKNNEYSNKKNHPKMGKTRDIQVHQSMTAKNRNGFRL
jgi:hypothetical protein